MPERTRTESVRVPRAAAPPPPTIEHNKIESDAKAGASEIQTQVVKLQDLDNYVENGLMSGELKRQHGVRQEFYFIVKKKGQGENHFYLLRMDLLSTFT
jgi:hypothetical protein